ncbi:hypothetical protein [Geodermatophilus marinus]|uniref:hypothetical protein n=1 Tax=Geodermatophilus sp. LHW52908 TaxID=2303986 RepID=UPI000E3E53FD|nr:hypothetical protein [Geodermatophilus sp. LHW52908]RFU20278.1 hypothetical protein D0Z06_16500 [Geodermatophilus sp. LHW52908]
MDDDQHGIQDSCEAYFVYVLQKTAEDLGVATIRCSHERWAEFVSYLTGCGLTLDDFELGEYGKYKRNADLQLPNFVQRLAQHYKGSTFFFENVEARERNAGRKADVFIHVSGLREPIPVSLKNYIGGGGITRPQVSSGTFLSFAAGFVFNRIGVGTYEDPRPDAPSPAFSGSDVTRRNAVLDFMRRVDLKAPLETLDRLQAEMRADLLGPDCEMYDQARVRAAVERAAEPGMEAVLEIFRLVGLDQVREKFLARIGMDGKEEALFFDSARYVDSITNPAYHKLREKLNAETTTFTARQHLQNIRFEFTDQPGKVLLATDVPFTINTNGAWYRPKERYEGLREKDDKGHLIKLKWGQRRPYKSKEIATSTNTYLDLRRVGIFGK